MINENSKWIWLKEEKEENQYAEFVSVFEIENINL